MKGPTRIGARFCMLKPLWIIGSNVGWFSIQPGSVKISTGQVLQVIEISKNGTPHFGPACPGSRVAFENSGAEYVGISYRYLARNGQADQYAFKLVEVNNSTLESHLRYLIR